MFRWLMTLVFFPSFSFAQEAHNPHDPSHWYSEDCCNLRDCAPIKMSAVQSTNDGWLVTLQPEDHFTLQRKTQPLVHLIPYGSSKERQSQDGDFHACVNSGGMYLYCLYVPPQSF